MRLPSDAALLVIDVQMAIDDPKWGPRNNRGAEAAQTALEMERVMASLD